MDWPHSKHPWKTTVEEISMTFNVTMNDYVMKSSLADPNSTPPLFQEKK